MLDRCSTLPLSPVFRHPTSTPTHSPSSSRQPSTSLKPGNTFLTGPTFLVLTFNPRSLVAEPVSHSTVKQTRPTDSCRRRPIGPQAYRLRFSYSISFQFELSVVLKRATNLQRRLATNRRFRT